MKRLSFLTLLTWMLCSTSGAAQINAQAENSLPGGFDTVMVYKQTGETSLKLYMFYPSDYKINNNHASIVFFFGGGWTGGNLTQFEPHAKHLASLGMVSVLADYRVRSRHGTTPFEAVADARSAMRFLKIHAGKLRLDPEKMVAAGGSAGGHLAACTAFLPGLDEPGEDLSVTSVPAALVLYNPVIDNGPEGFGFERVGERYREISPAHNIREGLPPVIFFLGTNDRLIPVATAEKFKHDMEKAGNRCDLFLYEGQPHGFFNFRNTENYQSTLLKTVDFLKSLKLLSQ